VFNLYIVQISDRVLSRYDKIKPNIYAKIKVNIVGSLSKWQRRFKTTGVAHEIFKL
jgi:hypothetical protein